MKRNKIIFLIASIFALSSIYSCKLLERTFYHKKLCETHGHSNNCSVYETMDSSILEYHFYLCKITGIQNGDTILSIGAGGGKQEFTISTFTDRITFYLEDIDTSCISQRRINNVLLPHYSNFRDTPISNRFYTVYGSNKQIEMPDNSVNKILIYNSYHHFTNDINIIRECSRILRQGGKLIICEHVFKRNKKSYKFCDYGGVYKTEENLIKGVTMNGFTCDNVIPNGKYWRVFIFSKE